MSKLDKLYKWLYELHRQGFEQIIIVDVLNKIVQLQREKQVFKKKREKNAR